VRRLLLLVPLLLALAGCGQAVSSSAEDFQGDDRAVAEVVEELQDAGTSGDADRICADILATELVDRLRSAGSTCAEEMENAIDDADDFELQVEDVEVTGDTATATVGRGPDGDAGTATFEFTRENGQWRAIGLSSGG
jgi:hypothetical protein